MNGYDVGKELVFESARHPLALKLWHAAYYHPLMSVLVSAICLYTPLFSLHCHNCVCCVIWEHVQKGLVCLTHLGLAFTEGGGTISSDPHHAGILFSIRIVNLVVVLFYIFFAASYVFWTRTLSGAFNLKGAAHILLSVPCV